MIYLLGTYDPLGVPHSPPWWTRASLQAAVPIAPQLTGLTSVERAVGLQGDLVSAGFGVSVMAHSPMRAMLGW